MQVVINKSFLLNPKKKLAQNRLVIFEKTQKKRTLVPKNAVNRLKDSFRLPETIVTCGLWISGSMLYQLSSVERAF